MIDQIYIMEGNGTKDCALGQLRVESWLGGGGAPPLQPPPKLVCLTQLFQPIATVATSSQMCQRLVGSLNIETKKSPNLFHQLYSFWPAYRS